MLGGLEVCISSERLIGEGAIGICIAKRRRFIPP